MHKVCEIFNVDFDYFLEDKEINSVQKNVGGTVGNNAVVNIIEQPGILESIIKRIENLEKKI